MEGKREGVWKVVVVEMEEEEGVMGGVWEGSGGKEGGGWVGKGVMEKGRKGEGDGVWGVGEGVRGRE
ncbi:hypothetical protein [Kocuria rhizophila]|uniref:hypothetical protein n=1 Tax=Kocuria rhizophila TaxID=72000 RepID=UPI001642A4C2|nr:hypothetical protein [Kocuria rhizophila]